MFGATHALYVETLKFWEKSLHMHLGIEFCHVKLTRSAVSVF